MPLSLLGKVFGDVFHVAWGRQPPSILCRAGVHVECGQGARGEQGERGV